MVELYIYRPICTTHSKKDTVASLIVDQRATSTKLDMNNVLYISTLVLKRHTSKTSTGLHTQGDGSCWPL